MVGLPYLAGPVGDTVNAVSGLGQLRPPVGLPRLQPRPSAVTRDAAERDEGRWREVVGVGPPQGRAPTRGRRVSDPETRAGDTVEVDVSEAVVRAVVWVVGTPVVTPPFLLAQGLGGPVPVGGLPVVRFVTLVGVKPPVGPSGHGPTVDQGQLLVAPVGHGYGPFIGHTRSFSSRPTSVSPLHPS